MPSVLAIVAVSAVLWLRVVVRLDRHRSAKGSSRRVAGFFVLGMLSVVPTILLYRISFLDLVLPSGLLGDLLYQVCCVGPIEELSNFPVSALLATRSRPVRPPVAAMYQPAAVGLYFLVQVV